jgi:hypothetical protein
MIASLTMNRGDDGRRFPHANITIPSGTGRRRLTGRATFGSRVVRAAVARNGLNLDDVDSDHHINTVEAEGTMTS